MNMHAGASAAGSLYPAAQGQTAGLQNAQPKKPRLENLYDNAERVAKELDGTIAAMAERIDQLCGPENPPTDKLSDANNVPAPANLAARLERTVNDMGRMTERLMFEVTRLQRL